MKKRMTYKKSGVDIDKANEFVKAIAPFIEKTYNKNTIGTIGYFGGFFKADFSGMKDPVLVSATDGVGTKLMVANIANSNNAWALGLKILFDGLLNIFLIILP